MKYDFKLSICMMVKDEEENIRRCLDSLKLLVENNVAELIVVDTGSRDTTPEIVKDYTDKLYFHAWNDNFSDMRNISISYARGEWIFIIDADERLDNPIGFISLFLETNLKKYNTINLYVKNLYTVKDENNFNQNISPRLFRNDGSFRYEGSVHNQPIMKEPTINFDISLTHYGYISNDKELMEKKYKRTVALLKKELEINPNNIYYLFQLGVSYDMHGDHMDALIELRKAYALLSEQSITTKRSFINVYGSYIRAAYTNHEYEEVNRIGIETINLNNEYLDIYYILALTAKNQNNQSLLIEYSLQYVKLVENFNNLNISKDNTVIMYHIDEMSKAFIYSILAIHYMDINELDKAYYYSLRIPDKSRKINLSTRILFKQREFQKLREYYLALEDEDQRLSFIQVLEDDLKKSETEIKNVLYTEFQSIDDSYGALCEFRLFGDESNILNYLKYFDFEDLPLFYTEILLKCSFSDIITVLKPLSINRIRQLVKYLIDNNFALVQKIEEYLRNSKQRPNDLVGNKVFISLSGVLLVYNAESKAVINDFYYELFKLYIDCGVNYISQLYQLQKARLIYKELVNEEDRFFMLMHITIENIRSNNITLAIRYLHEALKAYKYMSRYIDRYKDEISY